MGNQHSDMTDGSMERDQALERRVHRQDGRQHPNSLLAGEKLSTPSEFVLVPVSVAARNSCCSLRRRDDAAATPAASLSAVAATTVTTEPPPLARIPLLDGDNIVGAGASNRLGLGIPKDTKARHVSCCSHEVSTAAAVLFEYKRSSGLFCCL